MASEDLPCKDWYSILGAESTESLTEIKQKYQKLVLLYHPDKQNTDVPAGEVEKRVQRFIEIDQAWKILGNEERKKEYDLQQRESELTNTWPVEAQVLLQDMSWNNDDQCYISLCRCGGQYILSGSEAEDVSLICCNTCSLTIEILHNS
ncbi:dnaJ homolog subfamily C member 24 isoform X1 [Rhinatrema bivittatum]|uniref:dnaJ homolog subfamily C member 24 isoform X1 n=1 Tax=Rhinatrema bivittatum TaxID=194408 RepID=UPI00112ABEF0|nr:dnaJ homolog subfamily C member 24 isoform X1 [Rhinatrema bivittatum]XP_029439001.1 dnaJ homolog subfamily C member 24 isoform X1 [Rhinatrema bivittatum]